MRRRERPRCGARWSDEIVIERCTRADGHRGRHRTWDRWGLLPRRWSYGDRYDAS